MTPAPVLRMLRAVLRWVHISDLHFGHGKAGAWADREIVLQQLIQDATELKRNLGAPHALFVTGDIAFSGKQKEYDDAEAWLGKLLKALDLKPEQVFLVPGNHDNDWGKVGSVLHQKIRSDPGPGVDAAVVDKKNKKPLLAKQAAYQKFAQRYLSAEVWYQRPLSSSLGPVQVLGLNSALASFDGDDKPTNLALGGRQRKLIQDQPPDTLVLVLQHHPTEWLVDGPGQQGLLGQRPHILFTGHVHVPGGGAQTNLMGHESWVIRAGTAHSQEKSPEPFVYAWGELSAEGFNYYPRVWFGGGTSQFKPDHRASVDPSGKVTIGREKLPDRVQRWLRKGGESSRRGQALFQERVRALLVGSKEVLDALARVLVCEPVVDTVIRQLWDKRPEEVFNRLTVLSWEEPAREQVNTLLDWMLPGCIVVEEYGTHDNGVYEAKFATQPLAELLMAAEQQRKMHLVPLGEHFLGRDAIVVGLDPGIDASGVEWAKAVITGLTRKYDAERWAHKVLAKLAERCGQKNTQDLAGYAAAAQRRDRLRVELGSMESMPDLVYVVVHEQQWHPEGVVALQKMVTDCLRQAKSPEAGTFRIPVVKLSAGKSDRDYDYDGNFKILRKAKK